MNFLDPAHLLSLQKEFFRCLAVTVDGSLTDDVVTTTERIVQLFKNFTEEKVWGNLDPTIR
jgi:hypothetical protein